MANHDIDTKIRALCRNPEAYDPQAYYFIFEALDHAIVTLDKAKYDDTKRHITGRELLEAIRVVAVGQFGWLAKTVFNAWGVDSTEDFGKIVFQMVQEELLHKQETDTMDDFRDAYDFEQAFETDLDFDIPWDSITPRHSG